MKDKITKIIEEMQQKHPNDPTIKDDYLEIIDILSASDERAISILNDLNSSQIDRISTIFEEVSANLQSKHFIKCLKGIAKKYPSILDIEEHVSWAIEAMD